MFAWLKKAFSYTAISCFLIIKNNICLDIPKANILTKVFAITHAKNIEFIAQFPDYKDYSSYGIIPFCLDISYLKTLNTEVDWSNISSWGIKSNKDLYVAKINSAFIAP